MTAVLEPEAPPHARAHLAPEGDLDGAGAARLRVQVDDVVAPGVHLVLDLSSVRHLSAEGLGVLVHAYRRLRDGGGSLSLSGASEPVRRVLRVSGLHRVLPPPAA